MSIIEIAAACGFVSTPHFSKCYREHIGIPPREERTGMRSATTDAEIAPLATTELPGIRRRLKAEGDPVASRALNQAQFEPTYGSVMLQ